MRSAQRPAVIRSLSVSGCTRCAGRGRARLRPERQAVASPGAASVEAGPPSFLVVWLRGSRGARFPPRVPSARARLPTWTVEKRDEQVVIVHFSPALLSARVFPPPRPPKKAADCDDDCCLKGPLLPPPPACSIDPGESCASGTRARLLRVFLAISPFRRARHHGGIKLVRPYGGQPPRRLPRDTPVTCHFASFGDPVA